MHKRLLKGWNRGGFSLILVILILGAVGAIAFGLAAFGVNLQKIAGQRSTVSRMSAVRDALMQYYRAHQDLPQPVTAGGLSNVVPVQALNLAPEYRTDADGQFFYYRCDQHSGLPLRTDINVLKVRLNSAESFTEAAAVLIAKGGDQVLDTVAQNGNEFTRTGDDRLVGVNLYSEAAEIARYELSVLQNKVRAACSAGLPGNENLNDCSSLPNDVTALAATFALADSYTLDPWLNLYAWGTDNASCSMLSGSDPRYHRYYSPGPDDAAGNADDIIASGPAPDNCTGPEEESPFPQPENLTLYLDFEEGAGTQVSFTNDDGTFTGTLMGGTNFVEYGAGVDPPPGSTDNSYALYFDGNGDYVRMDTPEYFNITEDFSLGAWVMTTGLMRSYAKVISRRNASYKYYFLGSKGTGGNRNCATPGAVANPYAGVASGPPNIHYTTTRNLISMPCEEWHHIATVFDYDPVAPANSTLSMYYDGDLMQTLTNINTSPPDDTNIVLTIGADNQGSSAFFRGWIDQVFIYDTALTEAEIEEICHCD